MIRIEETRKLTDGSHEIVDSAEFPERHTRKAGAFWRACHDSLSESGLHGAVRVYRDGTLVDAMNDKNGRLMIF